MFMFSQDRFMASVESPPNSPLLPLRKRQRPASQSSSSGSDDAEVRSRQRRRQNDLSVEVCKDFIRRACRRPETGCKFAHPHPAVIIKEDKVTACADSLRNKCFRGWTCRYFHPPPQIQESLLKAISTEDTVIPMPQRPRSRSPSSGSEDYDSDGSRRQSSRQNDISVDVCKDFIRGSCRRAETECKFAHPHSTVAINWDKVIACADSLRNKCFRGRTCRYFHPPPQIQEPLLKAIGMEDTEVPMVCKDFIKGRCGRKECRFAHHSTIDECAVVCKDFLRAQCARKSCRFSHALADSAPLASQYLGPLIKLSSYPQPGKDQDGIPMCRDFLKNACNRDSCKFAHSDSHAMVYFQHHELPIKLHSSTLLENGPIPNANLLDNNTVPLCKDFLKNACNRDSCKYFHFIPQPEAYLQQHGTLMKLPNSSSMPDTEQESLPVCKDFLNNACHRDSCKYAHPNSQTKVIDNQVEICRDFRRGLCNRTICRFYHPHAHSDETVQDQTASNI